MELETLFLAAPKRRQRRDELFAMVEEFRNSSDPNVVQRIKQWEAKFNCSRGNPLPTAWRDSGQTDRLDA